MYYFLFFVCIISRLITSIYYIEDIDSLRFALSLSDEFNITKFQPHFPGYPVFCFLGYLFYKLTGSIALSFSLIGGISTFLIIYFSLQMFKINIKSKESIFLILIIFFNPMIWILSNRYMPDLLGLSIVVGAIYYIYYSEYKNSCYWGLCLAGLSLGIRLSYFPILLIPVFLTIIRKDTLLSFVSISIGVLIWLIPFIGDQGFVNLLEIGQKHTVGHFNDYGGTIITESNLFHRLKFFIHTIWSDGLGGYWIDRHWISLIISICLLSIILKTDLRIKVDYKVKIILASCALYFIWIFLFQNVIYKSRHVLPLVYFLIILTSYLSLFQKNYFIKSLFILSIIFLTTNIISDNKKGTAIHHLSNHLNNEDNDLIISNSLVNFYLKSTGLKSDYINIEKFDLTHSYEQINSAKRIKIIGKYSNLFTKQYVETYDTSFYHNPYMNRMWSEIPIYTLKNKNEY